ncbi:MAG: MFS transporter [Solirubrobacteraceae bacterium]|nr:MFS transporter [Solirubrobacteraceae bacterium]
MSAPRSGRGSGGRVSPLLLALTVGLVLADSSVVTLALPAILREFDSTVNAVAWVLIAFNLALALVALYGARLARGRAQRAFLVSVPLFIVACIACALAPSLGFLVGARAAQGLIGAVVVAAALELLVLSTGRDRAILLWAAAGVLGAAVGPALGGFLTEWLSWEAMFALQAPVAVLGLLGARGAPASAAAPTGAAAVAVGASRPALAPLIALTLAAAALSAALFLLVILLIEGWRHSPAEAALTVTVMPIAALVAGQWARARHGLVPAIAGSVLVAGGLAALGLMPGAHAYWSLAPQLAIGLGLGLALATLIGASIGDAGAGDERTAPAAVAGPAAWTVAARHAGICIGLLLLTPVFTADLERVRPPAERAGLSHVLDAPLPLAAKIDLAQALEIEVGQAAAQELPDLDAAFAAVEVSAADRPVVDDLHEELNEELDRGATEAFSRSFLFAALLALLAAGAAFAGTRSSGAGAHGSPSSNGSVGARLAVAVPGAIAAGALLVAVHLALGGGGFGPREVADPCAPRERPAGVERTQLAALATLDGAACKLAMPREVLLRELLGGERPAGVSEDELVDAFGAGIDRARDERHLNAVQAAALRVGLKTGGLLGIIGLLLPEE